MPKRRCPISPKLNCLLAIILTLLCSGLTTVCAQPGAPNTEIDGADAADNARGPAADSYQLQTQLNGIFRDHPALHGVVADVNPGIIALSGEVPDADAAELATKIARNLAEDHVIENRISLTLSIAARLEPALDNTSDRLQLLLGYLPLVVLAVFVVIAFWLLARAVANWETPFRRLSSNPFLQQLMQTLTGAAITLIGILFALEILDAMALVGAVLGTAGIAGLALGLAFRDTVENYIAGLLLSIRQPFAPLDAVSIEGFEGQVVKMTSRATILMGFDGNHIRIPNAKVFQGTMVNFSRNPKRRFDFAVGISTDVDLLAAQELAIEVLSSLDKVLDKPAPSTIVENLGDSNVIIRIFGWIDQRESDFKKMKSHAIRCIKEAFDEANYEMPEPIYRLRVNTLDGSTSIDGSHDLIESSAKADGLADAARSKPVPRDEDSNVDTAPDNSIEEDIREERAFESDDLLDPSAPRE